MKNLAPSILITFGVLVGLDFGIPFVTGIIAFPELNWGVIDLFHLATLIVLAVSGYSIYQGNTKAKYFALMCAVLWLYFHFRQLGAPVYSPEFQENRLGNSGFAAWKLSIDVYVVGIAYGVVLFSALYSIFRLDANKALKEDANKEISAS